MQLSVSTSPADPSLTPLLSGGDLLCPGNSASSAASFGAQFPRLASTPAAGPADVTVAPAVAELAPSWIGSTIPQVTAQPRLPALPGKPAALFAKIPAETPDDGLPASVANPVTVATPTLAPAGATDSVAASPTARGARRDETTLPLGVNPLSAEMAQALAVAPVPLDSAPVALALTTTARAESPIAANATAHNPVTSSSFRGITATASPLASPAGAMPTAPAVATSNLIEREISVDSAPIRSAHVSGPFANEGLATNVSETSLATSLPTADAAVVSEPRPAVRPEELTTTFGETPPSVRSFAPAEILSRQFAFTAPQPPAADLASPSATALPPPFPVAAALAPSASQPLAPALESAVEISSAIASGAVESTAVSPREFAPNSRAEKTAPVRGAKIAATGEIVSLGKKREENAIDKTFVKVSSERVAGSGATVGTDVAKSEVTMSAPFNHHPAAAAVLEHAPVAWAATPAADRSVEFSATSVLAPETTEAAHRAVEAVLTAVERFSTGERHSVNLNFSVGGNDLNVRVELRADEVHATFLTDSPELRTALAHEWQAAHGATDSGERALRLVTPVIAGHAASSSSASSSLTSFSGGDSSSRQRESDSRRSAADLAAVSGVRSSGARSSTLGVVADSTSASSVARSAPPTSHRLHTHA